MDSDGTSSVGRSAVMCFFFFTMIQKLALAKWHFYGSGNTQWHSVLLLVLMESSYCNSQCSLFLSMGQWAFCSLPPSLTFSPSFCLFFSPFSYTTSVPFLQPRQKEACFFLCKWKEEQNKISCQRSPCPAQSDETSPIQLAAHQLHQQTVGPVRHSLLL